jgi:cytochrome c556
VLNKALIVAAAVLFAAPSHAQFAKPEDAYKYRAAVMTLQGAHMGRINAQLKSGSPNMQVIADNVALLNTLNKLFFAAFPDGSDMVASSRAKPEIWTQPAKFKQYADKLNTEVVRLSAATKSGDPAATRSAFSSVAQACKACHDDFRRD